MPGLFNLPTPEAVRQSARDGLFKRSAAIASAPNQQNLLAAQAGGLLGQTAGESLGTRNVDPEVEGIRAVQKATESWIQQNNIDTSTPDGQLKMLGKAAELGRAAGIPKIYEAADAQAMKLNKDFAAKAVKPTADKRSGLIVNPETLEVVGSGRRSQITGDVTLDAGGDLGNNIFVRGDSALTAKLKEKSKAGEKAEELTKPEEKEQILQRETIMQRALDSQETISNMNMISQAAQHFRGGGTFRELGGAVRNIVSSVPGFESLDNMEHGQRELFFKSAMQSGINKAIEQKGNLNPQEFKAGLSTAIQKSDSAVGIDLATNAFTELARQDELVKNKMDEWKFNPLNKNKGKADLTGFNKFITKWTRNHPPIIPQGKGDNQSFLYYSKAKDSHEGSVNQKLMALAQKKQLDGEPLSEDELQAAKQAAMLQFDKSWAELARASKWR